ncbi:uncharacterized protein LOC116251410 isoform X2 [Nymphaea colorata]|nr:uncharacterized protein LOC116251410 isoform X2 [Nymphaea colorata]
MTGHGFSYRSQGEPTKRAASVQKIKGISATLRLFLRKFCNFYPVRARSICHDLFHTDLPAFMFGIWMNNAKCERLCWHKPIICLLHINLSKDRPALSHEKKPNRRHGG